MQRIKILDSMRGIAAAMIVFHHVYTRFSYLYFSYEPHLLHRALNFISDLNVEAVMFFFILSGLSIRLSLQKGLPLTKELFNEYVYRRLKRILPLYFVALIFTIVSGFITKAVYVNEDYSIKNLLGNIFFLQCSKSYKGNWFAPYGDNGPLWSLSFEMFYYFFFPVFVFLILKYLKIKTLTEKANQIALFVAVLFSLLCMLVNSFFFFPYIAYSALFCIWYSGFYISDLYLQSRLTTNKNFISVVVLFIITFFLFYLKSSAGLYKLFFAFSIIMVFIIIYILRKKYKGIFINYFEKIINFLFYRIGKGSYALYLLHYPLILILMNYKQINLEEVIIAITTLAILCSWLEQYLARKKWLFLKIRYIS